VKAHPNALHVWTDGSLNKRHSTVINGGTGIHIEYNNKTIFQAAVKLSTKSIAVSEYLGIKFALDILPTLLDKGTKIDILFGCDNRYVSKVVNSTCSVNPKHIPLHAIVQKQLRDLKRKHHLTIEWIPSHCNFKAHDLADRLADEGAQSDFPMLRITDILDGNYTGITASAGRQFTLP